jgi:signal transduction histidine kinase
VAEMRILKNPEVWQLYKVLAVLTIGFICLALLFNLLGLHMLKESIAQNIAAAIGVVIRNHPEAEAEIIAQLAKADADTVKAGLAILNRYGYDSDSILFETGRLQRLAYLNALLSGLFAAAACSTFIFLFARFLKKQYSRINDVTHYAKMIQEQDYALDIRDNSEGDISMLKNEIYKITTMLREQAETLQRDKRSLSDSIADISHQLKTPMTSLFVLNDLLSGDPDPETKQIFLQKIESQLKRMEWLVSSLLKLSKLDAGTVEMKKEAISARQLVESALEPLRIPIELKYQQVTIVNGHQDSYGPDGDIEYRFIGDFNWTREALVNILKNCVEHTPENGQIRIGFDDNPIYMSIVIWDNGKGIDPEDLPYIFNRFYKGKNAGDDSIGIGLAMAKAIITAQNGDINVESQKGNGTTFTIKFYKAI